MPPQSPPQKNASPVPPPKKKMPPPLTAVHALRDGGGVHEVAEAEDAHEVLVEVGQGQGHPRGALDLRGGVGGGGPEEAHPLALPVGHPGGVHRWVSGLAWGREAFRG